MLVYLLAALSAVGVVLLASRLTRGVSDRDPDGPSTSHAGSMLSALFLLAFAIAVVVPWTTNDAARQNTYAESQAIAEAYWAANQLPAPTGQRVQAGLREYADLVHGREWKAMADGRLVPEGWSRLEQVRREVATLKADDDTGETRAAVLEQVREITAARRQRAMDATITPPPGLLAVTVLTGVAVMLLPFLSGARPRGLTLVPMSLMAGLLAVGVYLVFDIAHVFTGALAVDSDAFTNVLPELRRISGGG